jgi:serpin B
MKIRSFACVSALGFLFACGGSEPPVLPPPTTATPPPALVDTAPVATAGLAPVADAGPQETPKASDVKVAFPPSTPLNELTMATMRALHGEKGNLFFSGASLRTALGMTQLGAMGATLDEMAKTLNVDPDPAKNVAAAKAEMASWKAAAGKAELVIANRLWIEKTYALDKTFLGETQTGYGASAVTLDFAKAPDPSRATINGWVSETTKGKIKDLLPAGSVSPLTRAVLTNAIYFKGSWTEAFDKKLTKDEPFQAEAGSVTVPMMHRASQIGYAETADAKVALLPYKDSSLEMVVVLPKEANQLGALEAGITGGQLDAWTKESHVVKVSLSMPRFTYAWGRSVKPELTSMGIKTAFTDSADFSALAKEPGLAVTDVFHQAFVLVDETGTEAAAATAGVMAPRALMRSVEMKLDRPFLFFVRNAKTGDVLFAGRLGNPSVASRH